LSVRSISKGSWLVDIVFVHADGRSERIRKVSPVATRRGAEEYERQIRQALLGGTHGRKETPTLAVFAADFMASYAPAHNKPQEVDAKRRILDNHLIPAWGSWKLDEIGKGDRDHYVAQKLKDGFAPKSIYNQLTVLGTILAEAAERGLIAVAPKIEKPTCPRPDFDFLTFEEAERLLVASSDRWRPLILVGLRAGLRVGEIQALHQSDVDLTASRLTVRRSMYRRQLTTPKNGRERSIDLAAGTRATLEKAKHNRGLILFARDDGQAFGRSYLRQILHAQCDAAGLRRIGWHTLRHTFASHLAMRGVPLRVIQELMGHSSIEMTMRYAHLAPEVKRSAVESLETPERPLGGNEKQRPAGKAIKRG
jgi:integrase